jgi:hypothetical protein
MVNELHNVIRQTELTLHCTVICRVKSTHARHRRSRCCVEEQKYLLTPYLPILTRQIFNYGRSLVQGSRTECGVDH